MSISRPFALFSFAALLCASTLTTAQTPGKNPDTPSTSQPSPATAHYSFEVVSIRPSPPDAQFGFQFTPDGFRSTGLPLAYIILLAHFPLSLQSHDRIQNAPAWASKDRYNINAKVSQQDLRAWTNQDKAEPAVLRSMLNSMLVERCHLQMHTIPAEIPGFALAVSRRGATLHAPTSSEKPPNGMRLTDGGFAVGEKLDDGSTTWHFHNASIASLTNFLSMTAHTRIADQTGLTGRYDFDLAMSPDRNYGHGEVMDPATFWDLRALGLRTISTKVPTITLVIDHLDPPSEN